MRKRRAVFNPVRDCRSVERVTTPSLACRQVCDRDAYFVAYLTACRCWGRIDFLPSYSYLTA
ncbi:MAG: hypothetical protein LBN71_03775 [Tannerella sp.]|nr:hypothetical protein [Tannerella sp.]